MTLSHLQLFEEKTEFMKPTVTVDETWMQHFIPQTKQT